MKYPNKIEKKHDNKVSSILSFKNKGDNLEYDINLANHFYLSSDVAIIHKKPTPIKVVDVQNREKPFITKAFFQTPSTTDYNGIYRGKYIDFEAKETQSKTSFALRNIHKHQIKHLQDVHRHGGIAFIIVLFTNLNKAFVLTIEQFVSFVEKHKRKSIPLCYFVEQGTEISFNFHPRIDYLKAIDTIYFGGNNE